MTGVAEAAEAVVESRRALTAAERGERDRRSAEEAHRLALDRLRQALVEERSREPLPGDVTEWLREYLTGKGGTDELRAIKSAGHKVGHSEESLRKARERLRLVTVRRGQPTRMWWSLPAL
jgi:hypothetical protein